MYIALTRISTIVDEKCSHARSGRENTNRTVSLLLIQRFTGRGQNVESYSMEYPRECLRWSTRENNFFGHIEYVINMVRNLYVHTLIHDFFIKI